MCSTCAPQWSRTALATIERWQKAGVDQLMLIMQAGKTKHDDIKRSLELFGQKVLPRFKN
jgi:alkanesulfonate monooxygenase SsuD/methylene tetrahydromethanopterin reductase-like flavin-dependent oxidoreductase (luciferase family)